MNRINQLFKLSLLTLLFMVVANVGMANERRSLDGYNKRFVFEKDESGKVVRIMDSTLHFKKSFREFTKEYIQWFESNKYRLLNDYKSFYAEDEQEEMEQQREKLEALYKKLEKVNFASLVQDPAFNELSSYIDQEMKGLKFKRFRTMANLEDSSYFYRHEVFKSITSGSISLIKSIFLDSIGVDLALDVVAKFFDYLDRAKRYHQSVLLYYLSNNTARDLGLTALEHAQAISSIMEAEVSWYKFRVHKDAKKNWETFGTKRLTKVSAKSGKRLGKIKKKLVNEPVIINPYFAEVLMSRKNGGAKIMNTYYRKGAFSGKPTTIFEYDKPKKVLTQRRFYELLKFAIKFAPVPGISIVTKTYLNIKYYKQTLKEGLLYGMFEAKRDEEMMKILSKQELNPLERYFGI